MTIRICTAARKNGYRISVLKDGLLVRSFPATPMTVINLRNKEAERWAELADTVTADPIPLEINDRLGLDKK